MVGGAGGSEDHWLSTLFLAHLRHLQCRARLGLAVEAVFETASNDA